MVSKHWILRLKIFRNEILVNRRCSKISDLWTALSGEEIFYILQKKSEISQVRQFGAIKSVSSKQHRWLNGQLLHSVDFIAFCTFQQFKYLPSLINCSTYWFIWKEMSRMNLDFLLFKNLQEMFFVFQLINIGSLLAVTNVPPSGKHSQDLHHQLSRLLLHW